MAKRKTASDGTVFGVFNQGNGDYVAAIDGSGFHHAPPQYVSLPQWSYRQAQAALAAAVEDYDESLDYRFND